ncbi:hypothetical protein [Paraburkholderia sediminicola]|uniref:hypothetical protein n=1 Tax=Paraburkholderia sediminicola TaxID=458836 RepID=UPI0038B746AF
MRSTALPSSHYGNPEAVLEAKQASEARQERQGKRPTLTLKPRDENGWSKERQRAEALFEIPPRPVRVP